MQDANAECRLPTRLIAAKRWRDGEPPIPHALPRLSPSRPLSHRPHLEPKPLVSLRWGGRGEGPRRGLKTQQERPRYYRRRSKKGRGNLALHDGERRHSSADGGIECQYQRALNNGQQQQTCEEAKPGRYLRLSLPDLTFDARL